DLQPADRPVRVRRRDLEQLLRLVPRPRVPGSADADDRRRLPADVRRVPPAPEGGELHGRPGHGEARGGHRVGALTGMGQATTLASWQDGPALAAIVAFVERVTDEAG